MFNFLKFVQWPEDAFQDSLAPIVIGIVRPGGIIQLLIEDGRVRFAIDIGAASRARLKISSKLLSVACSVTAAERGGSN